MKLDPNIIAHHEAGHAVVARVLGIAVIHVMLFSAGKNDRGNAQSRSATWLARDADIPTLLLETDAKVSLAGPYAQTRLTDKGAAIGGSGLLGRAVVGQRGWQDDIRRANSAVANIVRLTRDGVRPSCESITYELDDAASALFKSLWERLCQEGHTLVEENWESIERVAAGLLKHRLPSDIDVDALIAGDSKGWNGLRARNGPSGAERFSTRIHTLRAITLMTTPPLPRSPKQSANFTLLGRHMDRIHTSATKSAR